MRTSIHLIHTYGLPFSWFAWETQVAAEILLAYSMLVMNFS